MKARVPKIPYIPLIVDTYLYFKMPGHADEKIKEYNEIVDKYNREIEKYNLLIMNEFFAVAHNDKFNIARQIEAIERDINNTRMSISDFEEKNNVKKFIL